MMNLRLLTLGLILCVFNTVSWALSNSDVSVSLTTSPHFILDHNKPCEEGPSASYVGIKVENISGGSLADLTVTLKTITSTSSRVATLSDSVMFIGSMDNNASKTAYYYIKFPCSDAVDVDFSFELSDDQSGTVTFNTTVTSKNTISASAGGQVDARTTDTTTTLGGLIADTITYSFGNIQVGDEIEFQPCGDSLFDPTQLVLLNCKIVTSDIPINVPVGTEDQMYFVSTKKYTGTNKKVKVVFFFVNKMTSGSSMLSPFASLTSGNNLKYSGNFGSGVAYTAIAPVSNTSPFTVERSIDNAIVSTGDTVVFTVDIINSSTEVVMFDEIVETLDTVYTFVAIEPQSEVTSTILSDEPTTSSVEEISFVGGVEAATFPYQSYTIEPSDTVTLVYSATAPSTSTTLDETTTEVMVGGSVGGEDESESCVGCGALPVNLLYFEVQNRGSSRKLNWSTASEVNNDYFEISRSSENGDYITIGYVSGKGNSVQINTYAFEDNTPAQGMVYYRLRQVDLDGDYNDYIASIYLEHSPLQLVVYPNPTDGTFHLTNLNLFESSPRITVHALDGQLLKTFGQNVETLRIQDLKPGVYMVRITSENVKVQTRLIKYN